MLKKRIPTILGLILLLVGVVGGVVFINQGTNFLPRAAPEHIPQKVKITNIGETEFVVSWITQEPALGFIKYSDNPVNLSQTAIDDRDQLAGSSGEYRTHHVSLKNLNPTSTYYFKIGSQNDQLFDNNGQPFSISLPKSSGQKPAADTIFGTVLTAVDTPAEGSIVYISIDGASPLSALVKQNGNWAVNLSQSRQIDNLSDYFSYDPESTRIDILVQTNEGEPTTAATTTNNDQPVPTIVIGRQNLFVNQTPASTPPPSPSPAASSTPAVNKFNLNSIHLESDPQIVIKSPSTAEVSSTQPLISGKAPPNTQLTITVHSPTAHTGTVVSSENGSWEWLVPSSLEPGDHSIVVTYVDTQGIVHSATKNFAVAIASLQAVDLAYAATPSATPVSTPVPTPTPIASSSPSPTPRTTVTATESAKIVAGNDSYTLLLIIAGLAAIIVGFKTTSKRV